MMAELRLAIDFGATGNSQSYLGGGWARSEPAFTWAVGNESRLRIPLDPDGSDADLQEYVLTLDLVPFIHAPELSVQRLIVSVNGTVVGSTSFARPTLLGYRFPAAQARRDSVLTILLQHPDASRPSDFGASADDRLLAFSLAEAKLYRIAAKPADMVWRLPPGMMLDGNGGNFGAQGQDDLVQWVARRTKLDLAQLAMQFESVGENCEFGLVQRQCGAEPLGLLRFSSTFLRSLIRGLDDGFEGIGERDDVEPYLSGDTPREYMIHEKKYGLVYHSFVYEGQRSIWLMREQESARLQFLRRKFAEELDVAEKIFVYKRNAPVPEEEILPLFLALRRHGNNTLLWVVPAERDRPSGTVEIMMPGLLKGYIDRFAPDENAHNFSFDEWMRVCANAWVLTRLSKGDS